MTNEVLLMPDDKSVDTKPVTISIVGTGTGQGGGQAPTPDGTIAETPKGQPNLRINVITPALALFIRAAHLFLVTFSGLLTADQLVLDLFDSQGMGPVIGAARAALAVVSAGFIKDLITIFSRLEGKHPLATGSI